METKDSPGELGERIKAAMETNRCLLNNAGLPSDAQQIKGRRFVFYYAFNGRKEVTVEGTIEGITITRQKNGTDSGMYIHLVPSPCIFGELPIMYFQFFTNVSGPAPDPAQPLKCGIFLHSLGKSLHTEFEGHLVLL